MFLDASSHYLHLRLISTSASVAEARGDIQDPFRKPNIGDFAAFQKGVGKWVRNSDWRWKFDGNRSGSSKSAMSEIVRMSRRQFL